MIKFAFAAFGYALAIVLALVAYLLMTNQLLVNPSTAQTMTAMFGHCTQVSDNCLGGTILGQKIIFITN